jgi:hypothetical protein
MQHSGLYILVERLSACRRDPTRSPQWSSEQEEEFRRERIPIYQRRAAARKPLFVEDGRLGEREERRR